jgi:FkbM family methyltransferase
MSPASLWTRVRQWTRRKRNSLHFGVPFTLSRNIELPGQLRLHDTTVELKAPDEHGVRADYTGIFLDDCYGLHSIDLRTDRPTILDIGANIGLFSLAARKVYPQAQIHAYEPAPDIESYLAHHATVASFTYYPEAVGAEQDTVELSRHGDSNQTQVDADGTGSVKMVSFQQALERLDGHVDLLKLDCEGGEWPLFSLQDLWGSIDHVVMEYHLWASSGPDTHSDAKRQLERLGYEVLRHAYGEDVDFGHLWARTTSFQ